MIKNIFKTTVRYFLRNKFFSAINVLGLAIGIATSILIFLFVQDELSYDKHFAEAENIYRLEPRYTGHGEDAHWAATQGDLAPRVKSMFPEVEDAIKLHFFYNDVVGSYQEFSFNESNVLIADTNFLKFFEIPVLQGDAINALKGPNKVVLSQSTAKRYFGPANPVGKSIKINETNYLVAAVINDLPANTHFHYDMVISMDDFRARGVPCDEGGPSAYYTYIRFKDKASAETFSRKAQDHAWQVFGYEVAGDDSNIPEGYELKLMLNPVTNIHLNGHAEKEIEANSDVQYIYIFSIVAFFVLVIACINYMNLTTAKSFKRAREVGVRKVLGAGRRKIFMQFISESYLVVFIAVCISLLLVWLVLPEFNRITGKELSMDFFKTPALIFALLIVYALIGFISGWYPSIVLSRFRPLKVLKSNTLNDSSNKTALYLRRGLVILQFAISVVLIIGAVTVYRQLVFIQNKKLGFDKEQVVLLKTSGIHNREKLVTFKNQIKQLASVETAAATSIIPGERAPFLTVRIPGLEQEQGNEGDDAMNMRVMSADEDMLATFGFKISAGRTFSEEFGTDPEQAFIVNQAAVEAYDLGNPVGARFEYLYGLEEPKAGKIVGVVEDFHYASLHADVEPLMIHIMPPFYRYLAVRLSGENQLKTISTIEEKWHADFSSQPFDYFFLDSFYDNLYKSEMNLKTVITYFTFLAIFIACLGLFGLAAYITELRTKEIGIRKVLGASFGSIVFSLSKEFIVLVIIANMLAWLPAWYYLDNWLNTFAFHITLGVGVFVVTTLVSLLIAFFTVGAQSTKAAFINPSQALKYE